VYFSDGTSSAVVTFISFLLLAPTPVGLDSSPFETETFLLR